MKVTIGKEASDIHSLYQAVTEVLLEAPIDRNMIMSVMLKIVALIAISEEWDKDEILQAFGYTYDMERFLHPTSKERH
jgi:hypothetical protein